MHNLNTVPLSALRAIEAIARTGNLARAADELGITPGALSQRLAKAEYMLGQTLFLRTPSGLKPTETCSEIAPRLTRAMADLSTAVADIRQTEGKSLTVSVAPIFASRWLIWRIADFHALHPYISLRIVPSLEVVDLDRSEVDVGIRIGSDPNLGSGATKLLDQKAFPVCSPEVGQRIKSDADISSIPVIRENEALYGWTPWLAERGLNNQELRKGPTYADASLCLDAAMTGQGLFMAWETLACDALDRGQVVAPFAQRTLTGACYWFATSQRSAKKPGVGKFQDWLESELARSVNQWRHVGA